MRITALLQKIHELASQAEHATAIDVDLMLDYTRVLYSDLLEWRGAVGKPELPDLQVQPQAPASGLNGTHAASPAPAARMPEDDLRTSTPQPEGPAFSQSVAAPPVQEALPGIEAPDGLAAEPELTLEEYLAQQGKDDEDESDDVAIPAHVARPDLQPVEGPVAVQTLAAAAPPKQEAQAPPRDIRTMIGINDKYQIMSELFGNDKAAYEQAIDFINRAESEQAAFNWLRERLWVTEDHSDAAMIFFDVVRRFKNP